MSILDSLLAMMPRETIGGVDVEQCAKEHVMLDIEFSPVLPDAISEPDTTFNFDCPIPCRVQQEGSRYCVWIPHDQRKYQWTTANDLKVMRARFLLMRGWYANNIDRFSHPEKQRILYHFFPHGLLRVDKMFAEKTN